MIPDINPLSPEFRADPHSTLTLLRADHPVFFFEQFGTWVVTSYRDVAALLREPRVGVADFRRVSGEATPAQRARPGFTDTATAFGSMLLFKNPPDHTRLRALVTKAFTPRRVEGLRPRIEAVVGELIDGLEDGGEMELIRDFASPLPVIVIAELLGVPTRDRERLKAWSDDLAVLIDGTIRFAGMDATLAAGHEFFAYLRALLEERRAAPRDDLISALIAARDEGQSLSEDELLATITLLLLAGHETTTNLIGNGMLHLLRDPGQRALLAGRPELDRSAVEELLRFEGPVFATSRFPFEDIEVRGQKIPAGREINLVLAAANRDPEVFADPQRLDLTRTDNRHLAFGHGTHFCVGAALARLEGQVAIRGLLDRLPGLELAAPEVAWKPGIVLRGLEALPVRF